MTTSHRKYPTVPYTVAPDVPFYVNRALREVDEDVNKLDVGFRKLDADTREDVSGIRWAAEQSAASADASAASARDAQNTALDLVPRVQHIETIAGLAPGDVSDATMANIGAQPDSQFRSVLDDISVQAITSAAERTVYVSARGSDTADGLTLRTAKATVKAALDSLSGPGLIQLPWGTVDAGGDLLLRSGHTLRGAGVGLSTINYTGTGTALASASPDVRTYRQALSDVILTGPGKTTSTVGLDLASVSEAAVSNVAVIGFGTGIRLRSTINGGAVYNRFYNVKAQSCATGWDIQGSGSNGNNFDSCRANSCDLGIQIVDSNNNTWDTPQIEACVLGVRIHATGASLSDYNSIVEPRFENNATAWETTALVRYTSISNPKTFGTAYVYIDGGQNTNHTGMSNGQPNYWQSQRSAPGGSWSFTRNSHGGSENPAFLVRDTNTSTGTPVTHQVETARPQGFFYRGIRNGMTYWDVDAYGNTRSPNGGYNELTERSAAPPAPAAGGARIYLQQQTASGKTGLYVRFATGSPVLLATEP